MDSFHHSKRMYFGNSVIILVMKLRAGLTAKALHICF